jgi:ribonuclease HI
LKSPTDLRCFPINQTETILPVPAPPWISPVAEIQNLSDRRTEALKKIPDQLHQETVKRSLIIFTDGSWIPGKGAGAAAVTHLLGRSYATSIQPAESVSNFETELIGIRLALNLAEEILVADSSNNFSDVAIFSNNQSALINSANPISLSSGQHIYTENFFRMKLLGRTIRLYWCPGHDGIEANERADSLAKTAALGEQPPSNSRLLSMEVPKSLAKLKQLHRTLVKSPEILTEEDNQKFVFRKDFTKYLRELDGQEKGLAATILQLRADTAPLNNFIFKIKTILDPRCTNCFVLENAAHFLMFCSKYRKERAIFKRRLRQLKCRINPNSFRLIMDNPTAIDEISNFILATN